MSPGRDTNAVEAAYRTKCIQLRQRMQEVELANDEYRARRERLVRGIRKMRLERAILLEALRKRMHKTRGGSGSGTGAGGAGDAYDEDTDDSTDSPPTPQERPMRIKRSHRRPDTSFVHESTPSRPGAADGPAEDGAKEEDMADAPADAADRRPSADYSGGTASHGNANNGTGDTQSNAGDSEMAQD